MKGWVLNARWLVHAWVGHGVAETVRVLGARRLAGWLHRATVPPPPWGRTDMGWDD